MCFIYLKQIIKKPVKYIIQVYFPAKGKTITQLQDVDVHTLIGNIGGYIGLFLGKLRFMDIFDILCTFIPEEVYESAKNLMNVVLLSS